MQLKKQGNKKSEADWDVCGEFGVGVWSKFEKRWSRQYRGFFIKYGG